MLTAKRSAGAGPDVNPINILYSGKETCKKGIIPDFETQGRNHRGSKQVYQRPHKKELMFSTMLYTMKIIVAQNVAVCNNKRNV